MGYPFGPGGYGGRLGAHRLRKTARAIPTATTAAAGRTYFSGMDMVDNGKEGAAGDCDGLDLLLLGSPNSMGSLVHQIRE